MNCNDAEKNMQSNGNWPQSLGKLRQWPQWERFIATKLKNGDIRANADNNEPDDPQMDYKNLFPRKKSNRPLEDLIWLEWRREK